MTEDLTFENIVDSGDRSVFDVSTKARGPEGRLPVTGEMLRTRPSGDIFGWGMNAAMGWDPDKLGGKEILLLSTHGGIRAEDGTPVARFETHAVDNFWFEYVADDPPLQPGDGDR